MAARSGGGDVVAREALDALTKELRRWRPGKIVAVVEGERRDIALPGSRRRRWEMVARLLLSLDWTRVELLDAKGALLHTVEAEVEATEDDAPGVDLAKYVGPAGLDREAGLLALMLKGQEVALKHQAGTLATVTEGNRLLVETVLNRLMHMESMFGKTLQLAHDAAQRVAAASAGGDQDADGADAAIMEMLKAATAGGGMTEAKIEAIVERAGRKLLGGGLDEKATKQATPNGAAKGA